MQLNIHPSDNGYKNEVFNEDREILPSPLESAFNFGAGLLDMAIYRGTTLLENVVMIPFRTIRSTFFESGLSSPEGQEFRLTTTKAPENKFEDLLDEALKKNNHTLFTDLINTKYDPNIHKPVSVLCNLKEKSNDLFLSFCAYMMEGVHTHRFQFSELTTIFYMVHTAEFNNEDASKRFIRAFVTGKHPDSIQNIQCSPPFIIYQKQLQSQPASKFCFSPLDFGILTMESFGSKNTSLYRMLWLNTFDKIDFFLKPDKELFEKIYDNLINKIHEVNNSTNHSNEDEFYLLDDSSEVSVSKGVFKRGFRDWHNCLVEVTNEVLNDQETNSQLLNSKANLRRLLILSRITKDPEFMIKIDSLIKEITHYPTLLHECKTLFPKLFDWNLPFDERLLTDLRNLYFKFQ